MEVVDNVGLMARTSITEQLKSFIRNSGQTRYQIAKETGISEAALSRFVAGGRGLALESIDKLAAYLRLRLVQELTPVKGKGR